MSMNDGELPQEERSRFNAANYRLRSTLMTASERLFFKKLREALGEKYDIYPQVNLDKIFQVRFQPTRVAFNAAKWTIDRRSLDFLITERETQRPVAGIELDDLTHRFDNRIVRDMKVEALFRENGINLIRFNTSDDFSGVELKRLFEKRNI